MLDILFEDVRSILNRIFKRKKKFEFMDGMMRTETISLEEFKKRYPDPWLSSYDFIRPATKKSWPLPEAKKSGEINMGFHPDYFQYYSDEISVDELYDRLDFSGPLGQMYMSMRERGIDVTQTNAYYNFLTKWTEEQIAKEVGEVKTMNTIWECNYCNYCFVGTESIASYDWCLECGKGKLKKQPTEMYNKFGIGTVSMGKLPKQEVWPMEDTTRIYPISSRVVQGPDPEVIKAIEGSIDKWRDILCGDGIDDRERNCPLCIQNTTNGIRDCSGCVVYKKAGSGGCDDTPYLVWSKHQNFCHGLTVIRKVYCPDCAKLAYEEMTFLQELLTEEQERVAPQPNPMWYYPGDHLKVNGEMNILVFGSEGTLVLSNMDDGCYFNPVKGTASGLSEVEFDKFFDRCTSDKTVKLVKKSSRRG